MYNCSPGDLRDFAAGRIWRSMLEEINLWRQQILSDLSAPTFSPTKEKMTFAKDDRLLYDEYLRGCLLALERFESLPENLATIIEEDQPPPPNNEEDLDHE